MGGGQRAEGELMAASSFEMTLLIFTRHRIRNILPIGENKTLFLSFLMKGRRSNHYEALRTLRGALVPPPQCTDEETKAGEVQGHPGRTTSAASGTGGILLASKIHTFAMHCPWMPPGPTHFLLQVRRLRLREKVAFQGL